MVDSSKLDILKQVLNWNLWNHSQLELDWDPAGCSWLDESKSLLKYTKCMNTLLSLFEMKQNHKVHE